MNSEKMAQNFSNSPEIKYGAHYVTLLSDKVSYENPNGKFMMKYINPTTSSASAYDRGIPKNGAANVVNDNNLGLSNITKSNYIELHVPEHLFYITKLDIVPNTHGCGNGGLGGCNPQIIITRKEYYKGQKFIVVNGGGDVDTPCIVGVV